MIKFFAVTTAKIIKENLVVAYRVSRLAWEFSKLARTAITGINAPVRKGDLVFVKKNRPDLGIIEGDVGLVIRYKNGFIDILQGDGTIIKEIPSLVHPPIVEKYDVLKDCDA